MSTATTIIDTLTRHGVMLKLEGDKLMFGPPERVSPELKAKMKAHKRALLVLLRNEREPAATPPASPSEMLHPDPALASAYRTAWQMVESEPMEAFQAAYAEIEALEQRLDPVITWKTLRTAAQAHYANHQQCPFCKQDGTLHLPAEQPELELRHGR